MKLNPEDLDIMSFPTDTGADLAQANLGPVDAEAAAIGPVRPLDPHAEFALLRLRLILHAQPHRPMIKLNAEALTVESFDTAYDPDQDATIAPPNDPTPATFCRWCPEATFTCP